MDSFFGIGLPELILILLLAGMVMGPHRIRIVARKLGRITAQLQAISRQFARQLNAELDTLEGNDVKGAWDDIRLLQKEVQALRDELGQAPRSIIDESKGAIEDAQKTFSSKSEPADSDGDEAELTDRGSKISLPKAVDVPDDPE
jgi:Sec-independent protein translocase protein TatA